MDTTRAIAVSLVVVVLVVSGASATAAATPDENPSCDSPSQGFAKSVENSDGTSLERAGPGLVNARTKIGCETLVPS